jgi:hypothetical protein
MFSDFFYDDSDQELDAYSSNETIRRLLAESTHFQAPIMPRHADEINGTYYTNVRYCIEVSSILALCFSITCRNIEALNLKALHMIFNIKTTNIFYRYRDDRRSFERDHGRFYRRRRCDRGGTSTGFYGELR